MIVIVRLPLVIPLMTVNVIVTVIDAKRDILHHVVVVVEVPDAVLEIEEVHTARRGLLGIVLHILKGAVDQNLLLHRATKIILALLLLLTVLLRSLLVSLLLLILRLFHRTLPRLMLVVLHLLRCLGGNLLLLRPLLLRIIQIQVIATHLLMYLHLHLIAVTVITSQEPHPALVMRLIQQQPLTAAVVVVLAPMVLIHSQIYAAKTGPLSI